MHFALAPVESVLPAVAVGADFVAVEVFAAAGAAGVLGAAAAAGAEGAAGAAGAAVDAAAGAAAFWMPPWPLQVPLPVEVVVVPSLQVVSAKLGVAMKANRDAATRPAIVIFFMKNSLI